MYELLAELLPVLAYGIGAFTLTVVGVLTERAGIAHLSIGDGTLGLWMVGMGIVFLYIGVVLLGYQKFLKRATAIAHSG